GLELARHHRFHAEDSLFFGPFQKGPGYPLFLAGIFETVGESAVLVWLGHIALWICSLWLLWKISQRFLKGRLSLLPPLFLGFYWGAAVYVIDINSDLLALFLVLLLVYASIKYQEEKKFALILVAAFSLGFLILVKPITLYFTPIYAALLYLGVRHPSTHPSTINSEVGLPNRERNYGSPTPVMRHLLVFLAIVGILAGSWSYYNYKLIGTPQLASGGLTLMRRADDVNMSAERIGAFTLASAFGDYIADKFFPGYAAAPEPYTAFSSAREKNYYRRQLPSKKNELVLQQEQYAEARKLIAAHPVKFVFSSLIYVLRLNNPVNHRSVELIHTFVGTRGGIPEFVKIGFLVSAHLAWLIFVGTVIYMLFRSLKDWRNRGIILFLILYFNGMYALLTHAEARYILPVIPFYFLLLALFLAPFLERKLT
ncbi:MAG: glycosyltransferase family 39 protein, partial [Patescibacteria group bacterium]